MIPEDKDQPQSAPSNLRAIRFLRLLALCTGIALLWGTMNWLFIRSMYPSASWFPLAFNYACIGWSWGLVTPLIQRACRRLPLEDGFHSRFLARHLLAMAGVLATQTVGRFLFSAGAMFLLFPQPKALMEIRDLLWLALPAESLLSPVIYATIAAVVYLRHYYASFRENELRGSRLETQLAQAQVQALKMRLHPHFLFNALNAITALIPKDPKTAERMLVRLAVLLRGFLDEEGIQEVPLSKEMDLAERYLALERLRFGDRLRVDWVVPAELLGAIVPHLVLQPLIENAIRHGVGPKVGPGTIRIEARREGVHLELSVADDGLGCPSQTHAGLGLSNTRARLERLYGGSGSLEHGPQPEGGYGVHLRIPFRLERVEVP